MRVVVAVALAMRLLHVMLSAKVLVADDAVFFEQHARRFLAAWDALGGEGFGTALREAVDHASLQGIVYPFFQSIVYGLGGGVDHRALLLVQAVLGTLAAGLTGLTAQRAFGRPAGLVAGTLAALYAPFVLADGLLLAESLLLALQAVALYFLVRGLNPPAVGSRVVSGIAVGTLMLRPAFQYAGPALFLSLLLIGWLSAGHRGGETLAQLAGATRLAVPFLAGVLLIAVPWVAVNGIVFGTVSWSRTGDAWQQVYWGIYPPNRGWWPPDAPVPPKYGVESLPGAWGAGMTIQTRDLDYLAAALDQVRATPLQAAATEVNKLYQAYLHPFNNYAEQPPIVGQLAVPVHRLLAMLALAGLALGWRRPTLTLVLGAALVVSALPFLASHIDVRYTIPPAQIGTLFAGLAVAEGWPAVTRRAGDSLFWGTAAVLALPFAAWLLDVPWITAALPSLEPWRAHALHSVLVIAGFVAAGWGIGRLLGSRKCPRQHHRFLASGLAAGTLLAAVYGVQAAYSGDWHEWGATVSAGESARQTFVLPPGWTPPVGSRAEVRLYLQGNAKQSYVPVVRANGHELARLGPAFTDAGPLRFDAVLMDSARRQGKTRADVPQWYAVPLDTGALAGGRVTVQLLAEPLPGTAPEDAWVRIWGDYPSPGARLPGRVPPGTPAAPPGQRVYEGPAVHSRILGADNAFHKLVATGHPMLWRRAPLASLQATGERWEDNRWRGDDLSDAPGRQLGEYRIRLLVLDASGGLVALF